MKIMLALALATVLAACKSEAPKKPDGDQSFDGSRDPFEPGDYGAGPSTFGFPDTNPNIGGFNDPGNLGNGGGTYDYDNDTDCSQLYGSIMRTPPPGSDLGNYSNPLADCSRFNQGSGYQYQNPGSYNQQNNLEQQNRFYEQMLDNQRNAMLIRMIPSLIGALTGNEELRQQGLNMSEQFSNPRMQTPGMGLSGYNAQFGPSPNPYFQIQGLNPTYQEGMYNQFGQYGNYQRYNGTDTTNENNAYSNRTFYEDPNFSNGLSGRNSYYRPIEPQTEPRSAP